MSADCIFCKIVAGTIPAKLLYEDDEVIAFHDIRPLARVHFLIVPKAHIETLKECTAEHQALLGKMMLLGAKLAAEQGLVGYKTVMNVGREGGQEVFHIHLHVFGGGPAA
ncbi:histidine triad nucleotide-binding protein [Methylophilus glucosoxydans]|jgi:histidine triad (HIT) family protein|uniref:Histidine triad nucleotide-binding protein n=1 Tax=Methylophilus glucosoxydans TaxID=752553 RepID=A0ABW3GKQ7_9PROT|nr:MULTISPECIES: histidine triad nucleotide-binding protein [unclassified Methylophilus]MBF5039695.1 histidine triad nucleotide-binding protein [Methylophilus sp. 13]MDT7848933.1 histidine triad nucleotide-binding protein [Methylophilus sp. VKM B-3414]BEV09124.1 histidine triad nucleotide-binding protein [Methylophilus sp. DW102]